MTPSCSILFNIFSANPRPYVSLTLSSPSPVLLTIMGCICIHLTMPICWRGSYKQDIRAQTVNDKYSALLLFVMLSIIKVQVEFVGIALLGWQVLRIKWYNESHFFFHWRESGKINLKAQEVCILDSAAQPHWLVLRINFTIFKLQNYNFPQTFKYTLLQVLKVMASLFVRPLWSGCVCSVYEKAFHKQSTNCNVFKNTPCGPNTHQISSTNGNCFIHTNGSFVLWDFCFGASWC